MNDQGIFNSFFFVFIYYCFWLGCWVYQVRFVLDSRKFLLASQDGQGNDIDDLINCISETLIMVFPADTRYVCSDQSVKTICIEPYIASESEAHSGRY